MDHPAAQIVIIVLTVCFVVTCLLCVSAAFAAYNSGIKEGRRQRDHDWNRWCDHMKRTGRLAQDTFTTYRPVAPAIPSDS